MIGIPVGAIIDCDIDLILADGTHQIDKFIHLVGQIDATRRARRRTSVDCRSSTTIGPCSRLWRQPCPIISPRRPPSTPIRNPDSPLGIFPIGNLLNLIHADLVFPARQRAMIAPQLMLLTLEARSAGHGGPACDFLTIFL